MPGGFRRMLSRLQNARRWLPARVGPVFALLPHPLHHEVAQLPAGAAALPHVPPGVEVQGVTQMACVLIGRWLGCGMHFFFAKRPCIKCSVKVLLTKYICFCHLRHGILKILFLLRVSACIANIREKCCQSCWLQHLCSCRTLLDQSNHAKRWNWMLLWDRFLLAFECYWYNSFDCCRSWVIDWVSDTSMTSYSTEMRLLDNVLSWPCHFMSFVGSSCMVFFPVCFLRCH